MSGGVHSAVVLAGGRGTRMADLTRSVPKPLLAVSGRPLIGFQLQRLADAGVTRVVVATGYLAAQFGAALGDGRRWGVQLRCVEESSPLGTGGGLAHALRSSPLAGDAAVLVVNADLLSAHDLSAQVALFEAAAAQACLHVRRVSDVRSFGQVTLQDGEVVRFEEKPERPTGQRSGLINAGTYVVAPELILDYCPPDEPRSLEREVFPAAIADARRLLGYREDAAFLDVGTPGALRLAQDHPALASVGWV